MSVSTSPRGAEFESQGNARGIARSHGFPPPNIAICVTVGFIHLRGDPESMARRSPQTQAKRQRERAKQEKREAKEARKALRKAEKSKDSTDMAETAGEADSDSSRSDSVESEPLSSSVG